MANKNYTSVGKIAGVCLDDYLYDNRKKESALKFSDRVGFCAKTISRWRTNGVTSLEGLDCILQAMGKRVIIIDDDDDNSYFFIHERKNDTGRTPQDHSRTRGVLIFLNPLTNAFLCAKTALHRK